MFTGKLFSPLTFALLPGYEYELNLQINMYPGWVLDGHETAAGVDCAVTPIHMCFDIDLLDSEWGPSTGFLVPGGSSLEEGKCITERVY